MIDDGLPEEVGGPTGPGAIADPGAVRALLVAAARRRESLSYSAILAALGHRFSRPKMRALCRMLDAIDRDGAERGEPELAVLVVRESDRLPGQGWWAARAFLLGYDGPWEGAPARKLIDRISAETFDWWATREGP